MEVSADYRSQIERRILEILARGLEAKQLTEADSGEIAKYILDYLDNVQDHPQLVRFLEGLANRWPLFSTIGNTEMAKVIEQSSMGVTTKMENLVHQGNIDGALETAQLLKAHQ